MSAFEFYLKHYDNRVYGDRVKLLINYRSKKKIVKFISDLFYDGLMTAFDEKDPTGDELTLIDIAPKDKNSETYF